MRILPAGTGSGGARVELMRIMLGDEKLRKQAIELAAQINEVVKSRKSYKA